VDVRYPDWTALGHAIDYRIRLSLGGDLGPAVAGGVSIIGSTAHIQGCPARDARRALYHAGTQLLTVADAFRTGPGTLDEDSVIRLCFTAGFYEEIARTGQIRGSSLLAGAAPGTTLADLTGAVPGYAIADIAGQMRLAARPLAPFRSLPPGARVCGPVFTGSADIGGADADYILGGLLLDCKATKDPRKLGRSEFYQLAGLDAGRGEQVVDDCFRIRRPGPFVDRSDLIEGFRAPGQPIGLLCLGAERRKLPGGSGSGAAAHASGLRITMRLRPLPP
jgi:hypothetical protein